MPTVKHIAKARQRYEMVPVLDEDGKQKEVPVLKADKTPKLARGGRPVTRKLTEPDRSKPLPPRTCDYPSCPVPDKVIAIGSPFKCLSIKQQWGGRELFRHETCPSWQQWEYSNSLSARISQIQNTSLDPGDWEEDGDPASAAESVAEEIRGLAEEKTEAADNMEQGFGHETEQSAELREIGDNLNSWADEVEQAASGVDFPEGDPGDCGDGDCRLEHDHKPSAEQMEQWRDEAEQAIRDAMDNSPV